MTLIQMMPRSLRIWGNSASMMGNLIGIRDEQRP
jgi:hypothetical protein